MLLQTNSYIVPRDKRVEHARLLRRFRQTLIRLGCDHFEVYEQVGANWNTGETTGRFVQLMRFNDRKHQADVQAAERADQTAQALIQEFCDLINFPYQTQQGLFAVGFYVSFLKMTPANRTLPPQDAAPDDQPADDANAEPGVPQDTQATQESWQPVDGLDQDDIDEGEILGLDDEEPQPADASDTDPSDADTNPLPIGKIPGESADLDPASPESPANSLDDPDSTADAHTEDHSQSSR